MMIRDEEAEKVIKQMMKEVFDLSDEDADKIQLFKVDGESVFKIDGQTFKVTQEPNMMDHSAEVDPLIELFDKDDHYEILMETSGYAEEQLFINVKKEGDKINLIFGVQNATGRMSFRRMELPDDATEIFKRDVRGSVVELLVEKTK